MTSPSPSQQEKVKQYKPSHILFIGILVLIVCIALPWAFHTYCELRAPNGVIDVHFGREALNDFVGGLQMELELGQTSHCEEYLSKITQKVKQAIDQNGTIQSKLSNLLTQLQSSSTSCVQKMQEIHGSLTSDKNWLVKLMDSQKFRWVLFTLVTVAAYGFMIYEAHKGSGAGASEEQKEAGMWLDFSNSLGGYRQQRGNVNSPSLFDIKDPWEIGMMAALGLVTVIYIFSTIRTIRNAGPSALTLCLIQFMIYIHVVMLLYMIPVNAYHQRYLYNLRCYAATVVERPSYELLLAFIFIVLLPLPGVNPNTGIGTRFGWLALKLGLFYIVQSVLLGAPHYKIEPYTDEKNTSLTKTDYIYYGIVIGLGILLVVINTWGSWGCDN